MAFLEARTRDAQNRGQWQSPKRLQHEQINHLVLSVPLRKRKSQTSQRSVNRFAIRVTEEAVSSHEDVTHERGGEKLEKQRRFRECKKEARVQF